MLEKLLFIGIGAAGTYFAIKYWPGKLPVPTPCKCSGTQLAPTSSNAGQATVQPAVLRYA